MGGAPCELFHCLADMINILYMLTGLGVLIFGLILVFYPWGDADPGFFFAAGITLFLFSFCILTISWMGSLAYKYKEVTVGPMSGKRILGIYFAFLTGLLVTEIYFVDFGMKMVTELTLASVAIKTVRAGQYVVPGYFEFNLLRSFNALFFGAARAHGCRDEEFLWLWKFLEHYCPEIQYKYCRGCFADAPTQCLADIDLCTDDNYNNGQSSGLGPQCPYAICRPEILDFVSSYSKIIVYCLLGLLLLHLLLMLIIVVLFCFAKKTSLMRRRSLMKVQPAGSTNGLQERKIPF